MSLFRPDHFLVGLAPMGATMITVKGGRKPTLLGEARLDLDLDPREPRLELVFESLRSLGPAVRQVRFTLADALVRYFVAETPAGLRSVAELQDVVAASFEEQYGLAASDWIISCDLRPGCQSYLACAAPRPLIESVRAGCVASTLRLKGVAPFAVSEMNRWHARLPKQPFWFAAASAGTVTLGYHAKADWRAMRTHAQRGPAWAAVKELAERDGLRLGVEETPAIYCAGWVGQTSGCDRQAGMNFLGSALWPGQGETWSSEYRLALSGVWQ